VTSLVASKLCRSAEIGITKDGTMALDFRPRGRELHRPGDIFREFWVFEYSYRTVFEKKIVIIKINRYVVSLRNPPNPNLEFLEN
jgi:hypothetical protein